MFDSDYYGSQMKRDDRCLGREREIDICCTFYRLLFGCFLDGPVVTVYVSVDATALASKSGIEPSAAQSSSV